MLIRVPDSDKELWEAIIKNEDKIKALLDGGFFDVEFGKVTVSVHDSVVVTIGVDQRTYQRNEKVIPTLLLIK